MKKTVVVPLAPGFEEIEAVAIIDVLRRAGLDVRSVSVDGSARVKGAHDIEISADGPLAGIEAADVDAVVLPGGMPGAKALAASERVLSLVRAVHAAGNPVAAICAAPIALEAAGLLGDGPVTAHPSVWDQLGRARVNESERVLRHGLVTTSQGPGTAIDFALALVRELVDDRTAQKLKDAMRVGVGGSR